MRLEQVVAENVGVVEDATFSFPLQGCPVIAVQGKLEALERLTAVGVPRFGAVSVGDVEYTITPVPVSSVITPANCADVVTANCARVFAVRAIDAGNVAFAKLTDVGVPSIGVTSVGEVPKTSKPVPVSLLITPASCADVVDANCDSGLAVKPIDAGNVALARLIADGVPRFGVVNVGDVPNINAPEPLASLMVLASWADVVAAN